MKKQVGKRVGALALCGALLCGGVFAISATKTIEVQYMDVKLVVDGVQVTPKDANGAVVEPFIYNGTTYLPVRAIGKTLGKEVDWDGNTKTVYVGKIPGTANSHYLEPYQGTHYLFYSNNTTDCFTMMGQKYSQGLTIMQHGYALFNLNGQYSTIEFDVGHCDGNQINNATFYFYVDGNLVQEIELTGDMQTKHISVPVSKGLQLKIEKTGGKLGLWDYYGIANLRGIE